MCGWLFGGSVGAGVTDLTLQALACLKPELHSGDMRNLAGGGSAGWAG